MGKENVAYLHNRICSPLRKKEAICRKLYAIRDNQIRRIKPASERQITCFLQLTVPRFYIDTKNDNMCIHTGTHTRTCIHDMKEQAKLMTKRTKCTVQKGSRSRKERVGSMEGICST